MQNIIQEKGHSDTILLLAKTPPIGASKNSTFNWKFVYTPL